MTARRAPILLLATLLPLGVLAAPPASGAPASAPLHYFNPRLDLTSAPRIRKAIDAIEAYLEGVDLELPVPWRGEIHRTISGAYGSGFLRHNLVGNDLDYFANVHLGTVALAGGRPEEAASEILRRIELYRRTAETRAERSPSSRLAMYRFMDTLPAALERDVQIRDQLAASLRRVQARQPYLVGTVYRGVSQVSTMEAGEGFLPFVANAQFYSNQVDHSAQVFWGIRGVSLQFFFTVDLKIEAGGSPRLLRAVPLSPLAPARQVSKLWQQTLSGVFASEQGAAAFAAQVLPAAPLARRRLEYAQGFLASMSFERQVRHYPVKFLKRLHLLLDAMYPVLEPAQRERLEALLSRELRGTAASQADQIKTLGETLRTLASHPKLLRIFSASGDVKRVLAFLSKTNARLRRSDDPQVRAEAEALAGPIAALSRNRACCGGEGDAEALGTAANAIALGGLEMVQALGIDDQAMERLWDEAEKIFRDLGFRGVRALAGEGGEVAFASEDVACGGRADGLLGALRGGHVLLDGGAPSLAAPRAPESGSDRSPPRAPRPFVLYLRCDADLAQNVRFERALGALERTNAGFSDKTSSGPISRR
jgi:hypothetical protein